MFYFLMKQYVKNIHRKKIGYVEFQNKNGCLCKIIKGNKENDHPFPEQVFKKNTQSKKKLYKDSTCLAR